MTDEGLDESSRRYSGFRRRGNHRRSNNSTVLGMSSSDSTNLVLTIKFAAEQPLSLYSDQAVPP